VVFEAVNQHSVDRHEVDRAVGSEKDLAAADSATASAPNLRGQSERTIFSSHELQPRRFSEEGLPPPRDEDVEAFRTFFKNTDRVLKDDAAVGNQLCVSAYGMDLFSLRYLLWELGVAPHLVAPQYGRGTALHCLALTYTMADAHGRSHVFALLKGKDSWLTSLIDPPLPRQVPSVLSRDIKDGIEDAIGATAQWLIRAGVPVDHQDAGDNTAMHHAAQGGSRRLVRLLLEAGADPNILNKEKRNPLHYALAFGHVEVAALLARYGADLQQRDRNAVRPIDLVENPGIFTPEEAREYLNVTQRPIRRIERKIHPEMAEEDERSGWVGGTGGWGPERLQGYEQDMECNCMDQYFADEISGEEIYSSYIARNMPVLIRGLLKDWGVSAVYAYGNALCVTLLYVMHGRRWRSTRRGGWWRGMGTCP
jgi:hypothetical protein